MSEHSPEPWTRDTAHIIDGDGVEIAQAWTTGVGIEACRANAAVMTQAAAMLRLLRQAVGMDKKESIEQWLNECRKTIKKTEGGAS
jgi:hypothetical protein